MTKYHAEVRVDITGLDDLRTPVDGMTVTERFELGEAYSIHQVSHVPHVVSEALRVFADGTDKKDATEDQGESVKVQGHIAGSYVYFTGKPSDDDADEYPDRLVTGMAAYQAYGESVGWITWNGECMKKWEKLSPEIRRAWIDAAEAVAKAERSKGVPIVVTFRDVNHCRIDNADGVLHTDGHVHFHNPGSSYTYSIDIELGPRKS